uniref:No apical meristem-associated C-terminal domain-containing protein n=1 Tax=Tanacetum cinerariifolium TaxID=118510 RepID=A0A699IEM3_TANCI|nr:hypothetical protein [Tanacetum cinerariifolium]
MRKKLGCTKVGSTYPKIAPNVTRGRTLDFGLWFYITLREKQRHSVVEDTMINGKWKIVHPNVAQFCRVYANQRYKTSGSSSFNIEFGDASINLNVDVGDGEKDEVQELQIPIGRNKAKGLKKKGLRSSRSSSSTNEEALARLMVFELEMQNKHAIKIKKEERLAFLEIKRKKVKCHEQELSMQEYKQRQEDIRFYMQPYDHLTTDALAHIEALRAEIKAR